MRENRTSGSEGGEPVKSRLPYPYPLAVVEYPSCAASPLEVVRSVLWVGC